MTEIKQQIPPILRPDHVAPVNLGAFVDFFGLQIANVDPSFDISAVEVSGISMNTGDLRTGDLFVAMPGLKTHGAQFAEKAIDLGCRAIVTDAKGLESLTQNSLQNRVPVVLLEAPRRHLGRMAAYVTRDQRCSPPPALTARLQPDICSRQFCVSVVKPLGSHRLPSATSPAK
jgi:UDP-N-acetylmuramoyl-L-alanyl-D-glutamate--2,6-diaminopimelate ligase